MTENVPIAVASAVEGLLDEAVAARIIEEAGGLPGSSYGNRRGIQWIRDHIGGYNQAAQFAPWFVLVDLDTVECAPVLRNAALPEPGRFMCFRIAVRALEVWLMADKQRLAEYMSVRPAEIPNEPELLADPKGEMLRIASRSRRRAIRDAMLPRPGSSSRTGAAYTGTLLGFVAHEDNGWRPLVAAGNSDSLARCLQRLRECIGDYAASLTAA